MAQITSSSTAEYFAKNLQQVGFSSPVKAVLTTLKEAVDNSLDACEVAHIAPEITVEIKRIGSAPSSSADLVEISVEDNGPGLKTEDLPKVFGEYLASSKFGQGRCSRGQQGIGISAATTWAQLTNASGARVISKTKHSPVAVRALIDVDIKKNKGIIKQKQSFNWEGKDHGLKAVFRIVGRIQLKGDGGLITYLEGTALVNPHLSLKYKLLDNSWETMDRVTKQVPIIPPATAAHPHTMKLGEFISHAHLFGKSDLISFFKKGFSKTGPKVIDSFIKNGLPSSFLKRQLKSFTDTEYKKIFQVIQKTDMPNPDTRSVLTLGEEALSQSIQRMGQVDFCSVIGRKPRICDHKPVVVETAVARFLDKPSESENMTVRLMRFANRVPLQFDKSACAITKAVESVNWKAYGLAQQKNNLPLGPYVFAVSVTSPFIKFKNASKETIDASDQLVEEIRRTLQQTGQKLARHIRREKKAEDLQRKTQYIKQFVPILVTKLGHITQANKHRIKKAEIGIMKILAQDTKQAQDDLQTAETHLKNLQNPKQNQVIKKTAVVNNNEKQLSFISNKKIKKKQKKIMATDNQKQLAFIADNKKAKKIKNKKRKIKK